MWKICVECLSSTGTVADEAREADLAGGQARSPPRPLQCRPGLERTGGGAVERAGLENRYSLRAIVGSNPTLSVADLVIRPQ